MSTSGPWVSVYEYVALTSLVLPTLIALAIVTFEKLTFRVYGVPESVTACAAGTARAVRARAPETAATVARMRMCVPLEGEVIGESVDSRDQIRDPGHWLYGNSA